MFGSEKVVTKSRRPIGCNRYCFLNASATEDRQQFGRGFNYQSQKLPNGCVPQPPGSCNDYVPFVTRVLRFGVTQRVTQMQFLPSWIASERATNFERLGPGV